MRSFAEKEVMVKPLQNMLSQTKVEHLADNEKQSTPYLKSQEKTGFLDMVLARSDHGFMQPTVKKKKSRKKQQQQSL
jgi:hypothetical protein